MDHPTEQETISQRGTLLLSLALAGMFALGLVLGFVGRPLVIQDIPVEVAVTVVPNQAISQAETAPVESPAESSPETTAIEPGPTSAPADEAESAAPAEETTGPTPTIMEFVLSDTRHFQGEPDAPVTLIEFSDFK